MAGHIWFENYTKGQGTPDGKWLEAVRQVDLAACNFLPQSKYLHDFL
jgi:hypothetical protein